MTAIVAGQGLGWINSSLGLLGAGGQLGLAGQGRSGERVYVNASTGNLVVQQQDEWLVGTGPDAALLRTYNSQGGSDADNGDNWRLGLSRRITGYNATDNTVRRIAEDGSEALYHWDATRNAYVSKQGAGAFDTLSWNGTAWTFTDGDTQVREVYEVTNTASREARLKSVTDLDGKSLTVGYNSAGLVNAVKTANGETVFIDYDSAAGKTSNITQLRTVKGDGTHTRVRYAYDSANRLSTVTVDLSPTDNEIVDGKTYVTIYTYVDATSRRLDTLTQSDGSKLDFDYDDSGRLKTVKEHTGGQVLSTSFDYSAPGTTRITDALGQRTELVYDKLTGRLQSLRSPAVGVVHQSPGYRYNADGKPTQAIDGQGKVTTYGYDSNGNRNYERDAAGNVIERVYGSRNELLTETRYRAPDPDGDGPQLPQQPARTRYVYDAQLRLRFVVDPDGRVSEHRYNGNGQRSSTLQHGGGLYSAAPSDLAALEAWAAGVGKAGSQRTDYSYDFRGQLASTVTYSQLDAAGVGLLNGEQSVTRYVYDPAGLLLQSIEARGDELAHRDTAWALAQRKQLGLVDSNQNGLLASALTAQQKKDLQQRHVTTYQYDGLNRLVRQTDAQGQVTLTVYNDQLRQTRVTLANGLVQLSVFDEAGRLLKQEQQDSTLAMPALGATTYQYDKLGRLVKSIDATGASRYTLYDAASRKVGEVDAEGALTEYLYDRNNRVTGVKRYANPVSPAMLEALKADPTGVSLPPERLEPGMSGWFPGSDGPATGLAFGENFRPEWTLAGEKTLWMSQTGTAAVSALISSPRLSVSAGKRYEVSAYTGAHRASVSLEVVFYNTGGQRIGSAAVPTGGTAVNNAEKSGGTQLSGYKRLWGFVTAPVDASSAEVVVRKAPTLAGQADSYVFLARPHFNEVPAARTTASQLNLRPPASSGDRMSFNLYDRSGRLARTLEADGTGAATVDYRYDGAGRLIETAARAGRVASDVFAHVVVEANGGMLDLELENHGSTTVEGHIDDRVTRHFYSDAGLLLGTLDGDGYLTEHSYDAAGRLARTRRYAAASAIDLRASGTLEELRPAANHANDTLTAYFYDAKGQLVSRFDAQSYAKTAAVHQGYLVTYRYDGDGRKTGETRYARLAAYGVNHPAAAPTVADHAQDQLTAYEYDPLGRLVREDRRDRAEPAALVTELKYDELGRLRQTTRGLGLADARVTGKRYDKQGRLTAELGGEGHKALAALGAATDAQIEAVWQKWATFHSYDKAGRRVATVTPNAAGTGDKTLYYYDGESRLTHSINALGEMTQYSYDAFGQQVRETRFSARVDPAAAGPGGLRSTIPAAVAGLTGGQDTARRVYDRRGRLTEWYDGSQRRLGSQSYNMFGEVASRTDHLRDGSAPQSLQSRYRYNRRGLLELQSQDEYGPARREMRTLYDAFGRVVQTTDARNGVVKQHYDRLGRQVGRTDALGVLRGTTYDAFSRVLTSTDALQRTSTYTYDPATRRMTLQTPEGIKQVTESNAFGERVSVSDGRTRTEYTYDRDGRLTSTRIEEQATGTLVTRTLTAYDAAGRVFETGDGRGTVTRTVYDAAGRVLTRTVDPNTLKLTTIYRYDAKGQAVWMRDANGVWTQTEYDADGRVRAVVVDPKYGPDWVSGTAPDNPAGLALRTEYAHDLGGRVLRVTEGAGSAQPQVTEYRYDVFGRRTEEVAAPGSLDLRTVYTYDENGNVTAKTDARGFVTRYAYDAENRLTWTVDASGAVRRSEYHAEGRLSRSTAYAVRVGAAQLAALSLTAGEAEVGAALAATHAGYASHAQNQVEVRVYDRDGRLTHSVDALGFVTRREYDGSNNVVKQTRYAKAVQGLFAPVVNPAGVPAELVSYAAPLAIAGGDPVPAGAYVVQDGKDQVAQSFYDAANRLVFSVDAEGGVTQHRYDGNGNVLETRRHANAMTGTAVVNGLLTVIVAADDARDQVQRSIYDRGNRQLFAIDGEYAVTQYEYDGMGRVKSATRYANRLQGVFDGQSPEVLDAGGTPKATSKSWVFRSAAGAVERDARSVNGYDRAGRLVEVRNGEDGVTSRDYDAVGRLTDQKEGVGTSAQRHTHYGYDAGGRLESETRMDGSDQGVVTRYVLDKMGNRERIVGPLGIELTETDTLWAQNTRKSLGYAELRKDLDAGKTAALLARYTTVQSFDEQGRLTRVTDAQGGVTNTQYDAFGNAVKILDPNGNAGYFYFDRRNQEVLHVDPDGGVLEKTYTAFGTVDSSTRYFHRVAVAGDNTLYVLSETKRPDIVSAAPNAGVYVLRHPELDQITRIDHDKLNRQTSITDAATYLEKIEYDRLGNKWRYTNKVGGVFTYTHYRDGRVKTETSAEKTVKLGTNGQPVLGGDAKPVMVDVVTTHDYDTRGNLRHKIEATGLYEERITEFRYDRLDRQTQQIGQSVLAYDAASRQEVTLTPTLSTQYDVHGNVVETLDARGGRTLYYYDNLGRQTARVDAAGVLTTYTYDKAGNKLSQKIHARAVQLSGGATLSAAAPPQVLTAVPPTGTAAVYVLTDSTNDRPVLYSYDRVGRQTSTRIPNIAYGQYAPPTETPIKKPGEYKSYTGDLLTQTVYDTAGKVVKQVDANHNVTRLYYDRAGRKVAQLDAAHYLVKWDYDGQGNISKETRYATALAGLTVNDSTTLEQLTNTAYLKTSADDRITIHTYDKLNRLLSETRKGVETATIGANGKPVPAKLDAVTNYAYDGLSNITRKTDATTAVTNWTFDKLGRQIKEEKPQFTDFEGASVRPTTEREYDALGNVRREIRHGKNAATETDDRVTAYDYDKNGWMIRQTDAADAVTEFRHDAAGNVTRKILKDRVNADGLKVNDITYYVYDTRNREIKNTDEASGTYRETRYNSFGEVTGRRTNGGGAKGAWHEIAEFDRAGRAWKTSAGDGIVKLHGHDRAGNLVMTLTGKTDLTNTSLKDATALTDTERTYFLYDARSKLSSTYQAAMGGKRETVSIDVNKAGQSIFVGDKSAIQIGPDKVLSGGMPNTGTPVTGSNVRITSGNVSIDQYTRFNGLHKPSGPRWYTASVVIHPWDTSSFGPGDVVVEASGWFIDSVGARVPVQLREAGDPYSPPQNPQPIGATIIPAGGSGTVNAYLGKYPPPPNEQNIDFITYKIYKKIDTGRIFLGETTIQTETWKTSDFQPDPGWSNSAEVKLPRQLKFVGQPADAYKLLVFTRAQPDGSWSGPKKVFRGPDEAFTMDSALALANAFDFIYVALTHDDVVVNRQRGSVNRATDGQDPSAVQDSGALGGNNGPGIALATGDGYLHLLDQGATSASLHVRYREKGSNGAWITLEGHRRLHQPYKEGDLPVAGWFAFKWDGFAAGKDYELDVTSLDAGDVTLKRSRLSFGRDAQGKVWVDPVPTPYDQLRDIIRFTERPDTRLVKVRYRTHGTDTYSAAIEIKATDHTGRWPWDTGFLVPNRNNSYSYDLIIEAFSDDQGKLLNNRTTATVSLGSYETVVSAQGEDIPPTLRLTLPSDQQSAVRIVMGYREKNTDSTYVALPTEAVAGEFHAILSGIPRPASGKKDYEYFYDTFDINGQQLGRTYGKFELEATAQSTARLDWVIVGPDNDPLHQIQRHFGYNAFGEASWEKDGRGNVTDFSYNTMGRLTVQQAPKTWVVYDNGYREEKRPTTRNYYDRAGRLVAVTDANENTQSQTWLAGGEGQQLTAERHAYGSKRNGYDVFGERRYALNELAVDVNDYTGRTDYIYDKMGRLVEMRNPERKAGSYGNAGATAVRAIETYRYDAAGQRIAHTNALDKTEKTYYDSLGRVTKTVSFASVQIRYDYQYVSTIVGNAGVKVGGWQKTTTNGINRTSIEHTDLFGRLTWKQDLGGHTFSYSYNGMGSVTRQTGSSRQDIVFSYYVNGYIESIWDKSTGAVTRYEYDKAGNRTLERYFYLRNPADINGPVLQNYQGAKIEYDALNRIVKIDDPQATILYDYDAVGNRRHVNSYYHDGNHGDRQVQDYWYTYDALNRFRISMGKLGGKVATSATDTAGYIELGSEGVAVDYNAASQRTVVRNAVNSSWEEYFYTADGYLAATWITENDRPQRPGSSRDVDLGGRVLTYKAWNPDNTEYTQSTEYSDDHRVKSQTDNKGKTEYYYYSDNTDTTDSNSNIDNASAVSRATADGAGELARTFHTNFEDKSTTNTYYAYEYWDEAKQFAITNQAYHPKLKSKNSAWGKGYSQIEYDVNGNVKAAIDVEGDRRFRYVTDAQGLILRRDEVVKSGWNNRMHRYYYVNGVRVGDVGNDGPSRVNYVQALAERGQTKPDYKHWKPILSADFDQNYEPIGANYPKTTPFSYTVRKGDTLQTVAAAVWGDRAMWYLIADANGLNGTETLVEGQRLTIPPKVANIHNNSGTFRVYDPAEAMGDVRPTLPPAPPPPAGKNCGVLGMIVMVVVAIVATVYTAGAAAGWLGAASTTTAGTTGMAAVGGAALGGGGGLVMGTAGFALGSAGATAVASAAIGGAVGAVASQAVGMAIGAVDSFSWTNVAMGAIGAGVGAGLGAAFGPATSIQAAAGLGAAGNAITQGVAVATGLQQKFEWRSVAASAIGSGVGYGVGKFMESLPVGVAQNDVAGRLFRGTVSGLASGGVQALVQGYRPNWALVAAQSFGNALGSSLADAASAPKTQGVGPWSDINYRNGSDIQSDQAYEARRAQEWIDTSDAIQNRRMYEATAAAAQENFRATERAYRQATDTGAVIRAGDTLERLIGGDKELMGRYMRGMGVQNANMLRVGQSMRADWAMSADEARGEANRFYAADAKAKAAAAQAASLIGADGMRIGPTVERARALGIYSGDAQAVALSRDYEAALSRLPGQSVSSWDGVSRLPPAQAYLAKARGGLDAVRGDNWHFQVAQGLPDAAAIAAGDLAAAKVVGLLSRAATPVQSFLLGERSVVMSELQAEMRAGLLADLRPVTPLEGLSPTPLGWPGRGGAGPVPGTIGITDSTSVKALQNYYPKGGGVEFVYDPTTSRFATGRPEVSLFDGSPHEQLAQSIGSARNSSEVVGGTFERGPRGEFFTTENSGHYGQNWNNDVRAQFQRWLSERVQRPVVHESWRR
ncbi:polymorphic toxin type 43 domain-containing protein [Aquabacterium sp. A7-Y]|uniref:polymorphic toxin type 43 domain-containing protein n=1 Tax=Aquabacterium sp. A7-Y TaxID=1349605 RepID=UPI00223DB8ED|nr:polymorphic toxin type 43 domain-containing protein [Aquabacterium sp. A7-Y]MCW7537066.1 polymorphic toxin type 43 domain-containing protein [Aquabacterium sp. A7-Y]